MPNLADWFRSDEYKKLVEDMNNEHNKQMKDLDDNLTQDMVADIREWRVGDGPEDTNTHSWRGVARLFVEKYPEFSDNHGLIAGNQITGMQLCEAAMKLLNQKVEEGWN